MIQYNRNKFTVNRENMHLVTDYKVKVGTEVLELNIPINREGIDEYIKKWVPRTEVKKSLLRGEKIAGLKLTKDGRMIEYDWYEQRERQKEALQHKAMTEVRKRIIEALRKDKVYIEFENWYTYDETVDLNDEFTKLKVAAFDIHTWFNYGDFNAERIMEGIEYTIHDLCRERGVKLYEAIVPYMWGTENYMHYHIYGIDPNKVIEAILDYTDESIYNAGSLVELIAYAGSDTDLYDRTHLAYILRESKIDKVAKVRGSSRLNANTEFHKLDYNPNYIGLNGELANYIDSIPYDKKKDAISVIQNTIEIVDKYYDKKSFESYDLVGDINENPQEALKRQAIATQKQGKSETSNFGEYISILRALNKLISNNKATFNEEDNTWTIKPLKIKVKHYPYEVHFERV